MRGRCPVVFALPHTALLVCAALLAACSTDDGREMKAPTDAQIASSLTTTTLAAETTLAVLDGGESATLDTTIDDGSSAVLTLTAPWADGETIPDRYRCVCFCGDGIG